MKKEITADEVFAIAVKIEKNGALFYRDAAQNMKEEQHRQFLETLANMEDAHAITFQELQKTMRNEEQFTKEFSPDDENVLYLKALADMQVFFGKKTPKQDFKEILESAIQAEKDSIAFYTGMKEILLHEQEKEKIHSIIKEEMSHIRLLSAKLSAYIFNA